MSGSYYYHIALYGNNLGCIMSNTNASEENVESPSTYGNEGYKEYRKKERSKVKDSSSQNEINGSRT